MGRARPKGRCYLCGRMIWGRYYVDGGDRRHPTCVPNPIPGRRYGIRNLKGTTP